MPRTRKRGAVEVDPLFVRVVSRLREAVNEHGLSQVDIAERSGLTQGHISRVLRGQSPDVSFVVVARIALALDLSLDWLVEAPRKRRDSEPPASSIVPSSTG